MQPFVVSDDVVACKFIFFCVVNVDYHARSHACL